jgi:hypothetical protein
MLNREKKFGFVFFTNTDQCNQLKERLLSYLVKGDSKHSASFRIIPRHSASFRIISPHSVRSKLTGFVLTACHTLSPEVIPAMPNSTRTDPISDPATTPTLTRKIISRSNFVKARAALHPANATASPGQRDWPYCPAYNLRVSGT